jgi:hypothetical protein
VLENRVPMKIGVYLELGRRNYQEAGKNLYQILVG